MASAADARDATRGSDALAPPRVSAQADRRRGGARLRLARIVLLDQSRCQPNSPAFDYLRKQAGLGCPEARKPPCLQMREMRCVVLEDACPACLNRAKRCPNDAVRVVNLPHSLAPALTHRYGHNTFKLHKLPIPRPSQVLGLVGTNGIGKSTALKLLAGQVWPNLGRVDDPADWRTCWRIRAPSCTASSRSCSTTG